MIGDVRKGANEDEFRELNEHLEDRALRSGTDDNASFEILCECSNEECTARIRVSVPDYEAVRARPTAFIVLHGHGDPSCERVVSSTDGYEIVEKFGDAGQVAETEDPRGA